MTQSPTLQAFLLFVVSVLFVGCKSDGLEEIGEYPAAVMPESPAVSSDGTASRSYVDESLQPGDVLELFVEEDNSFNGKYTVRERGDLIIPNVGRIMVKGMSVVDAGARIRSELESSQLKKATVIVDRIQKSPRKATQANQSAKPAQQNVRITIYMSGSVKRAGQHRIPVPQSGKLGVYEAILIAGGLSQFGDPTKVHILRNDDSGKKKKIPVNVKSIENGLIEDPMIGEGDIVVVPEKAFGF